MKTIFTQQEIQQALVNYAELQGLVVKNRNINVSFTKGRGVNSLSAELDIEDPSNIFIGKEPEPVKEEPAVNAAPAAPVVAETPAEDTPPFIPDAPTESEEQAGNSVPSSAPAPLPTNLFSRD